jgi:septal ring factor EnvC (AmiA/AmiB activator)
MNRAPRQVNVRRSRNTLLLAALLLSGSGAFAQNGAPDPSKLKTLEKQLEQSQTERDRVQAQATTNARALETIRADMIALAKEIQDQENSLTVLENRTLELEADGKRMTDTLGRRDAQMTEVLMALERLALRPTDALTVNPLSPADAVRSAILLRSALPSIRQSSATLQGELKELYRVRAEIVTHREQAAAGAAALVEKHKRLDALAREKAGRHEVLVARGEDLDLRMNRMAREAEDLRALFAKLAEEKSRRDAEAKIRAPATPAEKSAAPKASDTVKLIPPPGVAPRAGNARDSVDGGLPPPSLKAPETEPKVASLPPSAGGNEETVTRSFAKARGTMPFPVAGSLAQRFGGTGQTSGDVGLLAKGITITARAGAQVVAPFDGLVAFAGPFRGYGQLLIIEHSEGYHTLLAGLGQIDASVGQRVLAGEPVGVMETEGAPTLYVELRRDGQPINPLPWLADRSGKKSG